MIQPSRLAFFWWQNYFSTDPVSYFEENGLYYDTEGNLIQTQKRQVEYWTNDSNCWICGNDQDTETDYVYYTEKAEKTEAAPATTRQQVTDTTRQQVNNTPILLYNPYVIPDVPIYIPSQHVPSSTPAVPTDGPRVPEASSAPVDAPTSGGDNSGGNSSGDCGEAVGGLVVFFILIALFIAIYIVYTFPPVMIISWVSLVVASFYFESRNDGQVQCFTTRTFNDTSAGLVLLYIILSCVCLFKMQNYYKNYYPGTPGIKVDYYELVRLFKTMKWCHRMTVLPSLALAVVGFYYSVQFYHDYKTSPCTASSVIAIAWTVVHILNLSAAWSVAKRSRIKAQKLETGIGLRQ